MKNRDADKIRFDLSRAAMVSGDGPARFVRACPP